MVTGVRSGEGTRGRGPGGRSRVWRPASDRGLELLLARNRRHEFPPHSHRCYSIGVVETGAQEIVYAGERHLFAAGSVAMFAPGVVHSARVHGDEPVCLRIAFVESSMLEPAHGELRISCPVVPDPEFVEVFRGLHRRLEPGANRDAGSSTELLEALGRLCGSQTPHESGAPAGGRQRGLGSLERCLRLAERSLEDGITVGDLARASGLSRFQLIRRFRNLLQMTPHAYLTQLRVRRAKELLRTGLPIVEVALACGFSDQSHLTRVFRRWVGVTPAGFR